MKIKLASIAIIFLIIFSSISVIGTQNENDCGCKNSYNAVEIENPSLNYHYAMGELSEQHHNPERDITFLGENPTSFSWKNYNGVDWVTPIKNQLDCGSCWAFATIGVIEALMNIQSLNPNLDKDLSEQYMVSCGTDDLWSINGCRGAQLNPLYGDNFIDWAVDNNVIAESCFPYQAIDSNGCKANHPDGSPNCGYPPVACIENCPKLADVTDWGFVSSDKESIKNALITMGPLAAGMAVYEDFFDYSGGIYIYSYGSFLGLHDVVIVGYNEDQDYWLCKNSWGTGWGESGFFKIGFGQCNIEQDVVYIEIAYGNPTDSKYANQCYDATLGWNSWGDHGMHCDDYWAGGPDYIYYNFNVLKTSPGPILIGAEFDADTLGLNGGPDIEVKDPNTGVWVKVKQSMGSPTELVWKWYGILNDYISSSDQVNFRVLVTWGCHGFLDDIGVIYTEEIPPDPVPDLYCDGDINGANIKPGATVTGSFKVKNIGEENSKLDWMVSDWPDWGSSWKFTPSFGTDLLAGSSKIVEVSFKAPDEIYKTFTGEITVVNTEDPNDSETVSVVVITPRTRTYFFSTFILKLLEKMPILRVIFSNLNYIY